MAQPPTAATVNPNAATAAVSAYNLSSAAAAAALRNLPTAPTNVAAVQTKRTQRRSASLSSEGSRRPLSPVPSIRRVMGLGGSEPSGRASPMGVRTLRRRDSASSMRSVSSMSERTFRSPSPHRFASAGIASQSPGRSTTVSAAGAAAVAATRSVPPPPVPPIPQNVLDEHADANMKLKKNRRITTLGFVQQPLRLASQQQKNPTSARASWFGPGTVGNLADVRTADAAMNMNNGHARPMSPTERPGSRSSLHNFSYPSRQRLSSPPASPNRVSYVEPAKATGSSGAMGAAGAAFAAALSAGKPSRVRSASTERENKPQGSARQTGSMTGRRSVSTHRVAGHPRGSSLADHELVYDANSRRMVPRSELLLREHAFDEALRQPHPQAHAHSHPTPRQHKKKQVRQAASLPPQPTEPRVTEEPVLEPVPEPAEEPITEKAEEEAALPVPALSTSTSTPSSSVSSLPALALPQTESPATTTEASAPVALDSQTPIAIENQASPVECVADEAVEESRPALVKRPSVVHEHPELEEEEERRTRSPAPRETEPEPELQPEPARSARSASKSPVRTAHFSPVVAANTLTVHSPPARSISPRKSAMKHSSSPRDTSPSDSTSDAATIPSQPPAPSAVETAKRRKANRVSFDEKATVLSGPPPAAPSHKASATPSVPGAVEATLDGQAAQPAAGRSRSWFSNIGRSKKKRAGDVCNDDDDVVMKPRPALPSFGSVRDKPFAAPQPEERALVKPGSETQPSARQQTTTASSTPPSALKSTPSDTSSAVSDSSAAAGTRNTANTSRYREPLPPVVTSVDGTGDVSDSGAGSDDDEESQAVVVPRDALVEDDAEHSPVLRFDEEQDTTVPAPMSSALAAPEVVPAISISHPSQEDLAVLEEDDSDSDHGDDGGAPVNGEADSTAAKNAAALPTVENAAVPVRQSAFEPITHDDDLAYSSTTPATVFATHMPTVHEEAPLGAEAPPDEDDSNEVFSDAYEDLSEVEGDGFLSLDAVLDSSTPAPSKRGAGSAFVGGTNITMSALMASAANKNAEVGTVDPEDTDDWAKAKAFWRGLTEERRLQLEREAREDAAADGDLEEEPSPQAKKPRQKKSVETRLAEKRAVLESSSQIDGGVAGAETPERKPEAAAVTAASAAAPMTTRMRRTMRSASVGEKESPAVLGNKGHLRTFSADTPSRPAGRAGMQSTLRRGSDSSESSFQRPRTATGTGTGFRKSLRASADAGPTAADTDAITLANTMANEQGSRYSVRSLSPTGSTTLHGSTESSPQHIRRTMRDGAGFAASEAKRLSSSSGPMATGTLRRKAAEPSGGGGGGFFSSLGKKSGGKHLQRNRGFGGGGGVPSFSRSRRDDSSDDDDDDDDVFAPSSSSGLGGGGDYTFRSRFADSSDEDEVIPEHRTVRSQDKTHVVPKTMRSSGGGMGGSMGMSASAGRRPGTAPGLKSTPVPEKLMETGSPGSARRPQSARSASKPFGQTAAGTSPGSGNIGTTTLRRTRSGRGQLVPLAPGNFSTATTVAGPGADASAATAATAAAVPNRQRRASSLMSVLRRKKPESIGSDSAGGIGRGEVVDSAVRRDAQLAAMRGPGVGVGTNAVTGAGSRTPRSMPLDGDGDSDGDASGVANSWPLPAGNPELYGEQKKKKFPTLRRMFRLKN